MKNNHFTISPSPERSASQKDLPRQFYLSSYFLPFFPLSSPSSLVHVVPGIAHGPARVFPRLQQKFWSSWAGKMAQLVKEPVSKTDDLSSIPVTHQKERTDSYKLTCDYHTWAMR